MKQLYYTIKFYIGLRLLKQNKLYYVDVWYFDLYLKKECVITFTAGDLTLSEIRWKRELLDEGSKNNVKITYVHFVDNMI